MRGRKRREFVIGQVIRAGVGEGSRRVPRREPGLAFFFHALGLER